MNVARVAVSSPFFVSGVFIGTWAPLIPLIKSNLGITESDIGLLIFIGGLVAIIIASASGYLISKFGSDNVTRVSSYLFLPSLIFTVHAPDFWWASLCFIWLFATVSVMDIAMNANGTEVEKKLKSPIMSSLHGFWSLGAMLGAGLGGILLAAFGPLIFTVGVFLFGLIVFFFTLDKLQKPEIENSIREDENNNDPATKQKLQSFPPRVLAVYLIGFFAFISFTSEGTILDWSALFLRQDIGASVSFSGFAFASFSLAMTIARFSGDWLKSKIGAKLLFQISTVITCIGLLLVASSHSLWIIMFGFFLTGLGNANIVPLAFSAASNVPGLKPGVGITTATFCGYIGLLIGPAIFGYVAEHFGFRTIYLSFAISMVVLFCMSNLMRDSMEETTNKA